MKLDIKQSSNLFFIVVLALSITNIFVFIFSHDEVRKNEAWVDHTNEVIHLSTELLGAMKDAETGQRGYLLTNNENYLVPYFAGIETTRVKLYELKKETADNPTQQSRLSTLETLVEDKFDELQETVDLQLEGQSQFALDIVNTNLGKQLMDEIRLTVANFVTEEKRLLKIRIERYEQSITRSRYLTIAASASILIVVLVTAVFVRTKVIKPITRLTKNAQEFGVGNVDRFINIDAGNELEILSKAFQSMAKDIKQSMYDLEQAKEDSERANSAKSLFLANMSHEVRTPLNGIYGNLQLLQQLSFEAEQKEMINNSLLSCRTLLTIINDILDFSKIEAGQLSIEKVSFSFEKIVHQVMSELEPIARDKQISIRSIANNTYCEGWLGDPVRIKQILLNLASNAVKFTDTGTIEIRYNCYISNKGTKLSIEVRDTGIGMSERALERLFERFEQADASTTRKFGGTGLGMSITKALVELMEGNISVKSKIGEGSQFLVTIPMTKVQLTSDKKNEQQTRPPNLANVKVLLAEDNKVNQAIFQAMLKPTGATVLIADDGKEAIELVAKNEPDLVFMDIQMPVMDGIESNKWLKQRLPLLPVIALTANVTSNDITRYRREGFISCVAKPIEIEKLYKALAEYAL